MCVVCVRIYIRIYTYIYIYIYICIYVYIYMHICMPRRLSNQLVATYARICMSHTYMYVSHVYVCLTRICMSHTYMYVSHVYVCLTRICMSHKSILCLVFGNLRIVATCACMYVCIYVCICMYVYLQRHNTQRIVAAREHLAWLRRVRECHKLIATSKPQRCLGPCLPRTTSYISKSSPLCQRPEATGRRRDHGSGHSKS
jgi:hypothetical protein